MTNPLRRCGGRPIFRTPAGHGSGTVITVMTMTNRNPPSRAKNRASPDELKLKATAGSLSPDVPLTTAECDYKLEKGLDAILDRFEIAISHV
jgi:hypothetical protein